MNNREPSYCYYIYNKARSKRLVITPWGVSVEYKDGGLLDTNICPAGLFPDALELTKEQKKFIAKNAVEGYYYSPEQMNRFYQQWMEEPEDGY